VSSSRDDGEEEEEGEGNVSGLYLDSPKSPLESFFPTTMKKKTAATKQNGNTVDKKGSKEHDVLLEQQKLQQQLEQQLEQQPQYAVHYNSDGVSLTNKKEAKTDTNDNSDNNNSHTNNKNHDNSNDSDSNTIPAVSGNQTSSSYEMYFPSSLS